MNNFQQPTFMARPGYQPQGMMGDPGIAMGQRMVGVGLQQPGMVHPRDPRVAVNSQQNTPIPRLAHHGTMGPQAQRVAQQGMLGVQQHRMAAPGMHPQGMMGVQQQRMGVGQQGMMGAGQRMPAPVVTQQHMMQQQRLASQQGMMGAQPQRMPVPAVSQQGMMGAQHHRMASPVVSQQSMMGAQHQRMASPVVSQQSMMGAQQMRMQGPMAMQQQRPGVTAVSEQSMMGTQQHRMAGPGVQQQGMMGQQQQRMSMPGVSQQSIMGTPVQNHGRMDPRVTQQHMMQGQQQRMMGMREQRMMAINQQRMGIQVQPQPGVMGAHDQHRQHRMAVPQQGMMGTTEGSHLVAQQQRIMVTTIPKHTAVGQSSQRVLNPERQVYEVRTSDIDRPMDDHWKKQISTARSNNVNIVINPQENLTHYNNAPSSTANSTSQRTSTLRTLVEVPLSFDTEASEKETYTRDVDHRLLKPDLDPGVLKDGDVDYRTLVPIRPAEEEEEQNVSDSPSDKPPVKKDIPLKLLVKMKPLKPLQKVQHVGQESKTDSGSDVEKTTPTKQVSPKPGLVPVPSKGPANKSKITLKLIDRTAKQKHAEEDKHGGIQHSSMPELLEDSVQMLNLSIEPTQQEILSALEEDCGNMNLVSSQEQKAIETTGPSGRKNIRLRPAFSTSAADQMETVQEDGEISRHPILMEDTALLTSPDVSIVTSAPIVRSETVTTCAKSGQMSHEFEEPTTFLSEHQDLDDQQEESGDDLKESLLIQTHSQGPLKLFPLPLQDKEERQARDDELVRTSLDAILEPSEVQNIAISFKNPIAEAFEPNKPGSPLLSLALKLTRLHKRNITTGCNGKQLRRTISLMEEGSRSSIVETKQKNNVGKELRLVISRKFANSGDTGLAKMDDMEDMDSSAIEASPPQDTRTVVLSKEAAEKYDSAQPTTFQDTEGQADSDSQNNCTPLNNDDDLLPITKEREHSQVENHIGSCNSPKRKALSDEDHLLPRKVTRSNSTEMCESVEPGTVNVKQEGGKVESFLDSTLQTGGNVFTRLSSLMSNEKDLQSRKINNNDNQCATVGQTSKSKSEFRSSCCSSDVSTFYNPETQQKTTHPSNIAISNSAKLKTELKNLDKLLNDRESCKKSQKEKPDCTIRQDCRLTKVPVVKLTRLSNSDIYSKGSNYNPSLSLQQDLKYCNQSTAESTSKYQTEGARISTQEKCSTESLSDEKNSLHTISVTLNFPNMENSTEQTTKYVQNLPKGRQSPQLALSSQSIPVILGRETPPTLVPKSVASPTSSPLTKTLPTAQQPGVQQRSPEAVPQTQGKFFRVCHPSNKSHEVSTLANISQEQDKTSEENRIRVTVKQETDNRVTTGQNEETASSDVRKVEFIQAVSDRNQKDPSTWPQGVSLHAMKHIILVDLSRWPEFFESLPKGLMEETFVWGFQDAKIWRPPVSCEEYCRLRSRCHFFLHPPCVSRKDTAGFAVSMVARKLDGYLPKHISFTVLPGDKGFTQLQNMWKTSKRKTNLVNPNTADMHTITQVLLSSWDKPAASS